MFKQTHRRVVVKVGSSTLTHATGKLNFQRIDRLCRTLADLKNAGFEVVLVSSGAQAAGLAKMGLSEKPQAMQIKQALCAIGQCELMYLYDKFFGDYAHQVGQVLLTADVVSDPTGRKNVINTFETLLKLGAIPVVNENDTVSYAELEIGDNDTLSAQVAMLCKADLLVLLSDIDGLYDKNPQTNDDARLIPVVEQVDASHYELCEGRGSALSTGGMRTKLDAATMAAEAGIEMVIANGSNPGILYSIFEGKEVGTRFLAKREAAQ